jgi:hypothetical protein
VVVVSSPKYIPIEFCPTGEDPDRRRFIPAKKIKPAAGISAARREYCAVPAARIAKPIIAWNRSRSHSPGGIMIDRRNFLKLGAAGGGAVFLSGLYGHTQAAGAAYEDFYFVQLSDSHWGFSGAANPNAQNTLREAVDAVNALAVPPDFIVFTGDLTHTTDDPAERRRRMTEFKQIAAGLKV